jgi:NAD(P)-dependent dehydrogenase (short-subunit alcohol dehydrogenase family)
LFHQIKQNFKNMKTQKLALITGVSREMGLGFETSKQLAQLGYKVIMTARNLETVTELASKLQQSDLDVVPMSLDILDDVSVSETVKLIEEKYGFLDVLVNNAGAYFDAGGSILETDLNFISNALQTNLIGTWRITKALVPLIRKSESGRIVNVSSGAGSFSDPIFGLLNHPQNVPVYGISKLALNGFTVKLAMELKSQGILVNSVCPGWVATYPGTAEWGARPVADGAKGIVWAATLPDGSPTGFFFRDGETVNW